jgi:carbamoyl-phosphate synthase large subunit
MREITVLVTGVGATTGISVIKGFRQQDEFRVRVVGTDINPRDRIAGSSFCDIFYTVPPAVDATYIPVLMDICKKEGVQVLIPIIDPELLALAEHKEALAQLGVKVVVSDPKTVRICNDKYATFDFLKHHDIPTPETWLIDKITEPQALTYPLFVKPRDGVSSVNAFRVDSPEELMSAKKRVLNLVVQEYLEGKEYTTDVLADFEGCVFAVVPRQRLQTKDGISYKGQTCFDDELIHWGRRISEILNIRGPANIQCMVFGDRISYFEVNPRFSGSLPLTIAAGVNTPLWVLKLVCGAPSPHVYLPFQSMVMTRYWSEVFYPGEQQDIKP